MEKINRDEKIASIIMAECKGDYKIAPNIMVEINGDDKD